jgi:hypothetical protein
MEQLPPFVIANGEEQNEKEPRSRGSRLLEATGWESVVFQVEDEPESSVFPTAAIAP